MWAYVDGQFVQQRQAAVPLTDRGFLYGDGCFEGIAVVDGRVLHLDDHLARLARSARMLRLTIPVGKGELRELVLRSAGLNRMRDVRVGYLRPLLTRGSGYLGLRNTGKLGACHLYILAQVEERSDASASRAFTAAFSSVSVPPASSLDPRIKSNNYLPHILALLEAQERGAEVAIHCDPAGFVTEAHAMNIFCVRSGAIRCPPEAVALAGITRAHVLEVARRRGYSCCEEPLTRYDFLSADEVFVTSSLDGVATVRSIDGAELPEPVPGPLTEILARAYMEMAHAGGTPVPAYEDAIDGLKPAEGTVQAGIGIGIGPPATDVNHPQSRRHD